MHTVKLDNDLKVLSGLSSENVGGQPTTDSRDFLVLRDVCHALYERYQSREIYIWTDTATYPPSHTPTILIPVRGSAEAAGYSAILSKASLYADLIVIVLPQKLYADETSFSSQGIVRNFNQADLRHIIELNHQYSDLVAAGRCVFLPSLLECRYDTPDDIRFTYTPPLWPRAEDVPYIPLNCRSPLTDPQEIFLFKHILLPYFPGADIARVAKLRDEETDSFIRFSHWLKRRIGEIANSTSLERIDSMMEEIEHETAGLRIEARKLRKSRLLQGAEVASFTVSLGALISGSGTVKGVAGIVGSVTAQDFLKEWTSRKKAVLDLEKSDFYIPYLLERERAQSPR